jgi:hypothetical protein
MARAFAPLRMALPNDQLVKELRRHPAAISGCVEVFRGWMAQGLRRTGQYATIAGKFYTTLTKWLKTTRARPAKFEAPRPAQGPLAKYSNVDKRVPQATGRPVSFLADVEAGIE